MASYLWQRGGLGSPEAIERFSFAFGGDANSGPLALRTHQEAIRCPHLAGLAERWLTATRYNQGLARLRMQVVRRNTEDEYPEGPLTDAELKSLQAAVRRRFVDTLLAEVEQCFVSWRAH